MFEPGGPPVFHRPPLYPLLLVPITYFPEMLQRPLLVVVQSLMIGCINALTFEIASKLFNSTVAKIAVWIFLINPWVYWNAKNPMTPVLQGTLYLILVYILGRELILLVTDKTKSSSKKWVPISLAIGFTGAGLSLTHGTMLATTSVLLIGYVGVGVLKRNLYAVKNGVFAIITVVALIAPWTYRNWVVFNRFIPVVGGAGLGYFNGNVHWAYTEPIPKQEAEHTITASLRVSGIKGTAETHSHWWGLKDIELEDKINKRMVADIRRRPLNFIQKIALNAIEFYFPALSYPFLAAKKGLKLEPVALTIFHLVLWLLAILALWHFRFDKGQRQIIMLLLVAVILYIVWYFPILTFVGHSLYTFGTIPILSILAAVGILCFAKKFLII